MCKGLAKLNETAWVVLAVALCYEVFESESKNVTVQMQIHADEQGDRLGLQFK